MLPTDGAPCARSWQERGDGNRETERKLVGAGRVGWERKLEGR